MRTSHPRFPATSGVIALVVAALSFSCGGSDLGTGPSSSAKGWTVLVYMVADNDLEPFAVPNLEQMARVGSSPNFRIVAEVDRSLKHSTDPIGNVPASATTKRLLVQNGSFQEVEDLGRVDSASAPALADFIQWGITKYPAKNYALILWDHGGGWQGYGQSETSGHILTLAALTQALRNGLSAAHLNKLQILGFDACLMSTFEVMEALKPFASYLIASEESEPGKGWDYEKLKPARDNPDLDSVALAKALIDGYAGLNGDQGAALTLALTSFDALAGIEGALTRLDQQITPRMNNLANEIGRARNGSLEFGKNDAGNSFYMVDLGDLLGRLAQTDGTNFSALQDELKTALQRAILYQITGQATSKATGMSVYFPPNRRALRSGALPAEYTALEGITPWKSFLTAFLNQGASAQKPTFANHSATIRNVAGGVEVSAPLTAGSADSIAKAELTFGYVFSSNGEVDFYGDRPASFNATTVSSTWNGALARFSQSSTSAYVYLSVEQRTANLAAAVIPIAYLPPGATDCTSASVGFATREILFDPRTGSISSDRYFLAVSGTLSELRPQAGSKFVPVVYVLKGTQGLTRPATEQGWYCVGTSFAADRAIALDFETPHLPAGIQIALVLEITNINGEGDLAFAIRSSL